jgi:3',5'-cyclic AMP phosphodiesterase CpdA
MKKREIKSLSCLIIIIFCLSTPLLSIFNENLNCKSVDPINSITIQTSNQGYITHTDHEIFWFIHVSDVHVTTTKSLDSFSHLLNNTFQVIKPTFISNTGDLVDSNIFGNILNIDEWKLYEKVLNDTNMNSSIYIDFIGNHDVSYNPNSEYFIKYSMSGSSFLDTQYSFNKSFPFGDYAFIGLDTTKKTSYNFLEFGFIGFLDTQEMDWYEGELEKYKNYDKIFVFSHHPVNHSINYLFSDVTSSGKKFSELNEEYDVFCYFCGHSHENYSQKSNGMLTIETTNFDTNGGTYRIVSIDNNQISTSIEEIGNWPQGIVTYPPREQYSIGEPGNLNKLRILAWDPEGLITVEWCAYNKFNSRVSEWKPLSNINISSPLWEGDWNTNLNDGNSYTIKVRITGGSGVVIKETNYRFQKNMVELYVAQIFIVITFFSISIIVSYYLGINDLKFEKTEKR